MFVKGKLLIQLYFSSDTLKIATLKSRQGRAGQAKVMNTKTITKEGFAYSTDLQFGCFSASSTAVRLQFYITITL